jgi:glutaredoxin
MERGRRAYAWALHSKGAFVAVTSTMLPLGTSAPDFKLPELVTGETRSLGQFGATGPLVMFICNYCPYVKHVQQVLARLGTDYEDADLDPEPGY